MRPQESHQDGPSYSQSPYYEADGVVPVRDAQLRCTVSKPRWIHKDDAKDLPDFHAHLSP